MDGQYTDSIDGILSGLARSVEAVFGLPAVPTLDWCDRAAAAAARLIEPALAVVTIGTLTDAGDLVEHEVSGVGVRHRAAELGRARRLERDEIGIRGEDGRVGALRVRAEGLRALGLRWPASERTGMVIGRLSEMPGGEAVARGGLADLWQDLDTSEPIVAIVALGPPSEGRVLIVQIAAIGEDASLPANTAQGLRALLPSIHRRTIQTIGGERAESTQWLTEREQVVLEHLSLGKSVRQIAEELGRSPHTVHDHVKSLHRKLGASSRGELIAKALGHSEASATEAIRTEPKPAPKPAMGPTGSIEPKPAAERVRSDAD